jgi:hypothetical protein
MKPHQQLEVFLPKLREGLRRKGIAEVIIASYEFDIRTRAQPRPLKTPREYQDAWIACTSRWNFSRTTRTVRRRPIGTTLSLTPSLIMKTPTWRATDAGR